MLFVMSVPVSSDFDLFDWNSDDTALDDGSDGILLAASISRGSPYIVASSSSLRLISTDGSPSRLSLGLNVPSVYTFEFQLRLTLLPEDFSDPDQHHLFLGILDPTGGAAGLLFSQEGLAVVGDPAVPINALGGSSGLIITNDDLVIRVIVDSSNKTAALYVTPSSTLTTTGHVLRHTLRLPASLASLGDALLVEGVGSGMGAVDVTLKSLRLGAGVVLPNKRPVAVSGPDLTAPRTGSVQLDGSESYDPEGTSLTYAWTIVKQPEGSDITMSEMQRASVEMSDVTITAVAKGSAGNGQRIVITDPGLHVDNDELLLTVNGSGHVVVTLRHESASPLGKTTAEELASAIINPTDLAYNATVAALVTAEVTGAALTAVASTVGVELANGADSIDVQPFFFPLVTGLYEFELVVNDGDLSSSATSVLVNCLESAVEIGRIPDPSFIWQYLPDFLDLVSDKTVFESVWRALIQLVGAEMLRLWQVDRNKSLKDIQSKVQDKWVAYPAAYSPTGALGGVDTSDLGVAYPLSDSVSGLTSSCLRVTSDLNLELGDKVVLYDEARQLLTVKDYVPWRLTASGVSLSIGSAVLTVSAGGLFALSIEEDDPVFVTLVDGTQVSFSAQKVLSTTQLELKQVSLVAAVGNAAVQIGGLLTLEEATVVCFGIQDSGTLSGRAADDGAGSVTTTAWFETSYGEFVSDIEAADVLRIDDEDIADASPILSRTSSRLTLATASLTLYSTQGVSWQVLRSKLSVPLSIRKLPWFQADAALGVVNISDFVRAEDSSRVFYGYVEAVSESAFAIRDLTETLTGEELITVLRVTELPANENVLAVPRLQRHGGDEEFLQQGVDYSVDSAADAPVLRFTRTPLTVSHTSLSAVVTVTEGSAEGLTGYLRFLGASETGMYRILSVSDDEVTLDHVFTGSGSVEVEVVSFYPEDMPDDWWAEYTYSGNWPAVETNFGMLVGLSHDDFSAVSGGDYLSSVKALHFALWSGPTVSNLRLGAQVFFNLPFTEAAGSILEISEMFSENQGRIVIRDTEDTAVIRSYFYPLAAGLAVNPDTGVAYVVGDSVTAFAPLSLGARVLDYINDPEWFDAYLTGADELRKFHTFKVEIDLAAVEDARGFKLLPQYLDRAKPAYTDYILVGLREVSDDIDVTDDVQQTASRNIMEVPYSTPDGAILSGTAVAVTGTSLRLASDAAAIDDVYNDMLLRVRSGPGAGQTTPILDYTGATRLCLVSGWVAEWGTPDATSTYDVVNPPSFPAGFFPSTDYFDGRGNKNSTPGRMEFPFGGDPPTAVVLYTSLVGSPVPDEPVFLTGGKFLGRYLGHDSTTLWLDVIAGSVPYASDGLTFTSSGATASVTSAEIGTWPDYSYINRERSEIWVPLDPDTIVGPIAESGNLQGVGGAGVTLALTASAVDDTYVNWMVEVGAEVRRVISYVGVSRVATLTSAFTGLGGTEAYTLSPPRQIAALLNMDFFKVGSIIRGQTSGHTAQVQYHGPSYLRLVNPSHNPYQAFQRGESLVGENGETATAVDDVFYVTPDYLTRHDRRAAHGPWTRSDARICFYVGVDGKVPTVDMGLVFDDTEIFQYPYDASLSDEAQFVPSFGPGIYWWGDNLLVYNTVDTAPTGPGSEPPWLPSPDVDIAFVSTDPEWNSNVLNDVAICRVIPLDPAYPPAVSAIPDPVILSIL